MAPAGTCCSATLSVWRRSRRKRPRRRLSAAPRGCPCRSGMRRGCSASRNERCGRELQPAVSTRSASDEPSLAVETPVTVSAPGGAPPDGAELSSLLEEMRRLQQRNEELAGQLGYLQRVVQEKDEQLRLLMDSRQSEPPVPEEPPLDVPVAPAPTRRRWWLRR